jgi:putative transposase
MHEQPMECSGRRMGQLREVSARGYEGWRGRSPRPAGEAEPPVQASVQHSCTQGRGTYGTRRIKPLLAQEGLQVSRRRMGRILAEAGLRGKT